MGIAHASNGNRWTVEFAHCKRILLFAYECKTREKIAFFSPSNGTVRHFLIPTDNNRCCFFSFPSLCCFLLYMHKNLFSLSFFICFFFGSLVCLALDWFALLVWYCKWTKKFNEFRERKRAIFHLHIFVKCLHDSNVLCLWMWRKRQTDTWTNGPTDRQTDWQKGCVCVASVYFYFNVQWSHYIVSAGCVRHGNMNMMIFAHVECYWMVT